MEALHEEMPFDLAFHPSSLVVATSLITGELYLFRYSEDSPPERLFAVKAHDESCRAVCFADSGHVLATDVETGKPIARLENAHENGINRFVTLTETTIASVATGHYLSTISAGTKLVSLPSPNRSYTVTSPNRSYTITSSNHNLSYTVKSQSEFSEDELLSVVVMENGQKVVCGTQIGALLLYSLGHFKVAGGAVQHCLRTLDFRG